MLLEPLSFLTIWLSWRQECLKYFLSDVISDIVFRPFQHMVPGLGPNR